MGKKTQKDPRELCFMAKEVLASEPSGAGQMLNHLWQLPSCLRNLVYMLGSGLITGPKGFENGGRSYRHDALSLCPGWIPLYRKDIPGDVLSLPTQKSKNLIPAIAALNMYAYQGDVYVCTDAGWVSKPYCKASDKDRLILVPAPLPTSWIARISFETEEHIKEFEYAANKEVGTVDISGVHLSVTTAAWSAVLEKGGSEVRIDAQEKTQALGGNERGAVVDNSGVPLYTCAALQNEQLKSSGENHSDVWSSFPEKGESEARIDAQERAQALGGMVAVLWHLAKRSELGAEVFKTARNILSSPEADAVSFSSNDSIIKVFPLWLTGKEPPHGDKRASFFFGLLETIIQNRKSQTQEGLTAAAREYVAQQLNNADGLRDTWPKLSDLIEELANLRSSKLTLTQQFEKFNGTVAQALLLFFQRDSCEELLEFPTKNPHVALRDESMIAAALLFGARDGWIRLVKQYKEGLSRWATSFMALKAHHPENAILRIKKDDAPKLLHEFFAGDAWIANEQYALDLARKWKWEECWQTILDVKSFSYNDGCLIVQGVLKTKTEIDKNLFLKRLGDVSIHDEQMIREKIRGDAK